LNDTITGRVRTAGCDLILIGRMRVYRYLYPWPHFWVSAPPVSFEWCLAGPARSCDAILKRLQVGYGGILGGPSAHDLGCAVGIIDCLNPIDAMSWNNSVADHPGRMAASSHLTQPEQKAESDVFMTLSSRSLAELPCSSGVLHEVTGCAATMKCYRWKT
jgi:hypothetical protein